MAIGLGALWGQRIPENFKTPFFKRNLQQFWNAWHITFMDWVRRYLFYPLVLQVQRSLGNSTLSRFVSQSLGILMIFIFSSAWHGWHWHYFIWGGFHALGLIITSGGPILFTNHGKSSYFLGGSILGMILTSYFVILSFIPFCLSDDHLLILWQRLFNN